MSKEIHALKDRTGQIFWPATATDAIIHPQTRLSLTDHIERYNLSDDETILTLEDGIDKLVDLEIDQHPGVQMVIKNEDGLIEEWTYFDSNEDFDEPLGWRKGGEIDTTLDATSENPVQNKAVYQAIVDNEEITAAALTDLEERTATVETLKADLVNGKVPLSQIPELPASLLPTALDDVLAYEEGVAGFPERGEVGKIYIDIWENKMYQWRTANGGSYVQLTTDLDIKSLVQPNSSVPLAVGDTYDEAFGKLVKIIRDNEIVTAEALSDLNSRTAENTTTLAAKADLVDGKVPSSQLPSFVDDVIEVSTYSNLPVEGETGKIYITTDTNKSYRWSGSTYFEIAGGSGDPLIIDLDEIYSLGQSVGQWSPDGNENFFWFSVELSDIPNTLDLQEICDAANENKTIYFKRGGQYYQVVKTSHTNNTSCRLTAYFNETEGTSSGYTISINLSNQVTENLTLEYYRLLHYKNVLYPVEKGIAIVTGEVITSMLGSISGVTIDSSSYYAIDLTNSENPLMPPANVFYSLAGNTDYDQRDSHFNLNRPVFLLKGIDSTTGVFNLLPLEKVDINYSMSSALETSQNITLKGEDSDNIYEISIALDNAGYSVPVRILPKKLIIEITFNGSEDDGSGNAAFEFGYMHDYAVSWSSLNVSREEIEDAIERDVDIYIKKTGEDDSYLVNKITRSSNYTTLYACFVDQDGLVCSCIMYGTSPQSLTATKGYYKFRDNVNQVKGSIVVLPGLVITSMLDPNATVNPDSYYALDVNSLFDTGSARIYTEKELFDELVGSTSFSSDANLIRPVLFFNGVDQITSIINLIPLKPSSIDFSLYWSTPDQGITLKAEGEDNIYTIAISSDNNTTPLTVTITSKTDLESIIEEGQEVTAAALNDLNGRVSQNRSDIDELEEVTSVSLNGLNERVEDLEDDVQGILNRENLIETTYLELKDLRDSGKLESGRFYRITDYQCTTIQKDTRSANNQFDIIVLALNTNTLSENARAIMHDNTYDVTFNDGVTKKCYLYSINDYGNYTVVDVNSLLGDDNGVINDSLFIDEETKTATYQSSSLMLRTEGLPYNYFSNCKLEAWEIKYRLDNDTNLFAWADPNNGRGVVYHMKDEFDNECPYDFKNIQFKRCGINNFFSNISYHVGIVEGSMPSLNSYNESDFDYYYTFSYRPSKDYSVQDSSIYANTVYLGESSNSSGPNGTSNFDISSYTFKSNYNCTQVCNNKIKGLFFDWIGTGNTSILKKQFLNNITLAGKCTLNTFEDCCYNFSLVNSSNNKFGKRCYGFIITGGNGNCIDDYCYTFYIDGGSYSCVGSQSYSITLKSNSYNTIGKNCSKIYLENGSNLNNIENGCNNITLYRNSTSNIFKNGCSNINFSNNYYRYITIESGNQYITLNCTSTTSPSQYYQNVTIAKGTNTTTTRKTISDSNVNQNFQTIYKPANCQEISV